LPSEPGTVFCVHRTLSAIQIDKLIMSSGAQPHFMQCDVLRILIADVDSVSSRILTVLGLVVEPIYLNRHDWFLGQPVFSVWTLDMLKWRQY
jgi:hypothetical protein